MDRSPRFSSLRVGVVVLAGYLLLGTIVLGVSTLGFIFTYRNDLLVFSAKQHQPAAVKTLLNLGATAFGASAIFEQPALVEYLSTLPIPSQGLVREGPEIVDALLAAGASPRERNASGWTPLMLASAAGQLDIVRLLVRRGAEIDARVDGHSSSAGMTALMAASLNGYPDIVRFLIEQHANVHLRTHSGLTALLLAVSKGHEDCVDALLEKGAAIPYSTIQVAENHGHHRIAERLKVAAALARTDPTPARRPSRYPEE